MKFKGYGSFYTTFLTPQWGCANCLMQSPFKSNCGKIYLLQVTQYCLDSERPISKVSGPSLSHQGCAFIDADYKTATNLVD